MSRCLTSAFVEFSPQLHLQEVNGGQRTENKTHERTMKVKVTMEANEIIASVH